MFKCLILLTLFFAFLAQARPRNIPFEKHSKKGVEFLENDDLQKAVLEFKIALRLKPGDLETLKNLGEAYELQENWDKALSIYEKLNKKRPEDYKILLLYLNTLERKGSLKKQMEVLNTLHKMDKKDFVIAIKYLKVLEANGVKNTHPKYMTVLEDLSDLPGSHVLFANMLGSSQRRQTVEQDARRDKSINKKMEFRKNLVRITRLESFKLDTAEYQRKLMGLITQYPDDKVFLEAQGVLYLKQHKYTQAKIFFNNIENPPPSVLRHLGRIYHTRENYSKAIKKLDRVPKSVLDVDTWELLIDALLSDNQKGRARAEANACIIKFPEAEARINSMFK